MKNVIFCLSIILLGLGISPLHAAPSDLPSGTAKGTFSREGETPAVLTHAAAFVDQKDEEKPVILILTDIKLPTESWTSEFDMMMQMGKLKFSGIAFFLNKEGTVFRCDNYVKGRQESASGVFELKLDKKDGKELTGTASVPDATEKHKLDVSFHATLK